MAVIQRGITRLLLAAFQGKGSETFRFASGWAWSETRWWEEQSPHDGSGLCWSGRSVGDLTSAFPWLAGWPCTSGWSTMREANFECSYQRVVLSARLTGGIILACFCSNPWLI